VSADDGIGNPIRQAGVVRKRPDGSECLPSLFLCDAEHICTRLDADYLSAFPDPRRSGKTGAAAEIHNGIGSMSEIPPDYLPWKGRQMRPCLIVNIGKSGKAFSVAVHKASSLFLCLSLSYHKNSAWTIIRTKKEPG